jgi:alpha-galactosidase
MTADGALPTAEQFFDYSFRAPLASDKRGQLPFSFVYEGQPARSLLAGWQATWTDEKNEGGAAQHTLMLTDPKTGLQCRAEIITYSEFGAVEWVVYFKNTSLADTPIIADIQALDTFFAVAESETVTLLRARGSQARDDDFAPTETPLRAGDAVRLVCPYGRSSDMALPFFRLSAGQRSVIAAFGWTGSWAAEFGRRPEGVGSRAGMVKTHLKLHPNEEIRTLRILLLFGEGEPVAVHNRWRRLLLAYHAPRPNGKLIQGPICDGVWGAAPIEDQLLRARWIKENNLPIEYFWVDAGWYGDGPYFPDDPVVGWYEQAGNWFPRKTLYPEGLKPLGEELKKLGIGFLLWMEPERVYKETKWAREHPEWLLGPMLNNQYLFNLGDPEARGWLTDQISSFIRENYVTCYRQDFNFDPAPYWVAADAPDRVGIAEIRHIMGLYIYWDELLTRHPGLIIDNCASGGRRIDLETISRSIPLWRSDRQVGAFDRIAMQNQTFGLMPFVPLSAGACPTDDLYTFRSAMGPALVVQWAGRLSRTAPYLQAEGRRQLLEEEVQARPYYYGDYYPLTPYSLENNVWAAWQFDRPDLGEGVLQVFRRPRTKNESMTVRLQALDPNRQYELRSFEGGAITKRTGREWMEQGVEVKLLQADAAVFVYKRIA